MLTVGIAYDLKSDFARGERDRPDDHLEEYDSPATIDALAAAIERHGHAPRRLGGGRAFVERVLAEPPDLVFNISEGHGTRSREAHVPSVLELLRIPFTHSDPLTAAASLDKAVAKHLVAAAGVPTPRHQVLDDPEDTLAIPLPAIVKPLWEGSSMGIRLASRAVDEAAVRALARRIRQDYGQPALVEEFCPGAELTVGVLGTGREARVLGVMEIAPRRRPLQEFVYSLEVKRNYQEEVEYHVPPRCAPGLLREVEAVALGAYRALGCRDVGRVDVRLDAAGAPHFLELNPLPGLNPVTGDIVIIAERTGVPFPALVGRIVDSARARYGI